MKTTQFNINAKRGLGVLAGSVLLIAVTQPASADFFGSGYGQESIGTYKGLSDDTVERLGGQRGVAVVIDNFFSEASNDNRINGLMDGGSPQLVSAQKNAMLQTLLGRPSIAAGTPVAGIVQLTNTQYNALVEDLYLAMENTRIAYSVQNHVMGSLSAYAPAMVSAYILGRPSVDQSGLNEKRGMVTVGQPTTAIKN